MKQLDNFELVKKRIEAIDLKSILFPNEIIEWSELTEEAIDKRIQRICSVPLCGEDFTVVYALYSRLKWLDVFNACTQKKGATVLEVGSGSSTIIPNAMTMYDIDSTYITANMNEKLTEALRNSISALPIEFDIIEDDANNIKKYLAPGSIDLVVFEHSANDVLQAILCEQKGIDTTHNDWFELLPKMIEIINKEYVEQTLEQNIKFTFLNLINNCLSVIKPGGYLAIAHYMFQYDLNLGYNPELWQNMVPIIRPWLNELSSGKEVSIDGFDPQWWMFYQKL
jgi:hypothetical protein